MFNKVIVAATCIVSAATYAQQPKMAMPYWGPASWTKIEDAKISADGKTVLYQVITEKENESEKKVVLQSLVTGKKTIFDNIDAAAFTADGRYVTLQTREGGTTTINTQSGQTKNLPATIAPKTASPDVLADSNIVAHHQIEGSNKILIFKKNDDESVSLTVSDMSASMGTGLWEAKSNATASFNQNPGSRYVTVTINEPLPAINPALVDVDVWSWVDASNPNPYQQPERVSTIQFAFDTDNNKLIRLTRKNERVLDMQADQAIVRACESESSGERWWNPKARADFYVVSLTDGQRHLLKKENKHGFTTYFSPTGRYIIIGDDETLSYSVYDTELHQLYDITRGKDITLRGASYMDKKYLSNDRQFLDNEHVIVRDEFDLWKLDLTGKSEPVCITAGMGRKHNIEFRPLRVVVGEHEEIYTRQQQGYLLSAFDVNTKGWGIYSVSSLDGDQPRKLVTGPHYYRHGDNAVINKAAHAEVYLVQRESVNDAPNLYVTKDLKTFERITDVQPHRVFNWMNVQLVKWQTETGRACEGMLYTPENLDPAKKYPVVTIIYNEFSQYMYRYPDINADGYGAINFLPLTSLVSNGYLVFVPDLGKRKLKEYLKETCRMIIPGIKKIGSLPFVDGKKIGLEGSSWGGIQTNYIITQTGLFAAAHSGAGYSELISHSGYSDAIMQRENMPADGFHIGGLLTEAPESYISQSALFYADKVTTPLLLRHSKDDGAVSFYQSLQFFRLLRRLGKPVWMLQYEGQGHGVGGKKEFKDVCIRTAQFFDHYLRDAPAPVWMTKGIPPAMKQVTAGYELDTSLGNIK